MTWHRIELALGVTLPLMAAAAASYFAHAHRVAVPPTRPHQTAAVDQSHPTERPALTRSAWQRDTLAPAHRASPV